MIFLKRSSSVKCETDADHEFTMIQKHVTDWIHMDSPVQTLHEGNRFVSFNIVENMNFVDFETSFQLLKSLNFYLGRKRLHIYEFKNPNVENKLLKTCFA